MNDIANSFLLVYAGLFPIVNPVGGAPIFLSLTRQSTDPERRAAGSAERTPHAAAFYPLTLPLTVGPGSISVAITLGSQRPKIPVDFAHLALLAGGAIAGVLAVAVTIYVCYRFAERIVAALGVSGTNVLMRLFAFVLLCIG